jgi:hypothetical protein
MSRGHRSSYRWNVSRTQSITTDIDAVEALATNRKVAGSNPEEVSWIVQLT